MNCVRRRFQYDNVGLVICFALLVIDGGLDGVNAWSSVARSSPSMITTKGPTTEMKRKNRWWTKTNVEVLPLNYWDTFSDTTEKKNPWTALVPLPKATIRMPWENKSDWTNKKGCDVTVEFTDPKDGARRLALACFAGSDATASSSSSDDSLDNDKDVLIAITKQLEQSMALFKETAEEYVRSKNDSIRIKARLVSSFGTCGGKCPRWHIDHVPIRFIQSFVGPGCMFVVGSDGVNYSAINELDITGEHDMEKINSILVDNDIANICNAKEGQPIIMLGHQDNKDEHANQDEEEQNAFVGCVHKSPVLQPSDGRILLTMDIASKA